VFNNEREEIVDSFFWAAVHHQANHDDTAMATFFASKNHHGPHARQTTICMQQKRYIYMVCMVVLILLINMSYYFIYSLSLSLSLYIYIYITMKKCNTRPNDFISRVVESVQGSSAVESLSFLIFRFFFIDDGHVDTISFFSKNKFESTGEQKTQRDKQTEPS
jgi:hypothetical protein